MKELRARSVLADCRWALDQYSSELSGPRLRVAWVGIVTLLRAVAHVLEKIDSKHSSDLDRVRKQQWEEWKSTKPEPRILWEFIEHERNAVLKQYEFGFLRTFQEQRSKEGAVELEVRGDMVARQEAGPLPASLPDLKSLITDGHFAGRPEKEVAAEAIRFWEQALDEIERRAEDRNS